MKRYVAPGDRGGARAAIGLQYVAIDLDLALAELAQIGHRAQAAADQPLDFLRASALPAARRLAVGARRRRTRQHPVFRGAASLAGIAQKGWHALLDRGGAQHMGVAELRETRAFSIFGDTGLEADRSHHIAGASRRSHAVLPRGRAYRNPMSLWVCRLNCHCGWAWQKFHREFVIAGAVRPVHSSMAAPTLALPRMGGREGGGAFCGHIPTL